MSPIQKMKSTAKHVFSIEFILNLIKKPGAIIFIVALILALYIGQNVNPTWTVEKITLDVQKNDQGQLYYTYKRSLKLLNLLYLTRMLKLQNKI